MIYLEDLGRYAKWLFDHPTEANGINLKIATEQVGWANLAQSFTEVTGKKPIFKDISLDEYFALPLFPDPEAKVGHSVGRDDRTRRPNASDVQTEFFGILEYVEGRYLGSRL
jgi:hypothetical protein